jgi:hypothetical protein
MSISGLAEGYTKLGAWTKKSAVATRQLSIQIYNEYAATIVLPPT